MRGSFFFLGTVLTRGGGAGAGAGGGAAGGGEGFRRGASSVSNDEAKDAKSSSLITRRFLGGAPDKPEASRAALALRRLLWFAIHCCTSSTAEYSQSSTVPLSPNLASK